jgi:hypothetical protein
VPTLTQIENSSREVIFSDVDEPLNATCPITMDVFSNDYTVTQIIPCGHMFSPSGINSWFQTSARCPVCRYDIRNYSTNSTTTSNTNTNTNTNTDASNIPVPQQTTRETRRRTTPPGDDGRQSQASSTPRHRPNSSTSNSSNTSNAEQLFSNDTISNVISNITEELINSMMPRTPTAPRAIFDPSHNSLYFDSSNNQFIFEGYLRQ